MNHICLLSNDEIRNLCQIISGKRFKDLFKKNFKEFSKIKKGFRVDSLSDIDALSIAVKNKDKPFIFAFINGITEKSMKEIENQLKKENTTRGDLSENDLLAKTLVDSFFSEQIELYFKLAGQQHSKEFIENIKSKMKLETLQAQVSSLVKELKSTQEKHAVAIEEHKKEKANLELALSKAQKETEHLQTHSGFIRSEVDDARRAQFDDTKKDTLSLINSKSYVSLCEVNDFKNEGKILRRYADINKEGQFELFQRNKELPPRFENRENLYSKDIPIEIGSFGVWNWSAAPNQNDISKDFVKSDFNSDFVPIEVVIVSNCTSEDDLANSLREGYQTEVKSQKVMFAVKKPQNRFVGILCNHGKFVSSNGKITFSDGVTMVPVYEFGANELIQVRTRPTPTTFYRSVFAGIPTRLRLVKSEMEIVKTIVLASISGQNFRSRGTTRTERQRFKEYIGALSIDDITDKISKSCYCSQSMAKQLLNQFIEKASDYLDGKSLDNDVIVSAISSSESLMSRAKKLIHDDWEKENHEKLTKAQKKLDSLNDQLRAASEELANAQKAFQITKTEEKRLEKAIEDKKQMAKDVEIAVAERIERAKTCAADFIASMAFTGGHSTQVTGSAPSKKAEETSHPNPKYVKRERVVDLDDLEKHSNWSDVIDTAEYGLLEAGVAKNHACGLAAYLCAAYIEKQPLLLVGPNAREIITAFSMALLGQKSSTLYCEREYSNKDIQPMVDSGESIVEIVNLLSSGWINRLPEILSVKNIFFVATHPYTEDVQVEPRSLFDFMLPVFTEFFIDKKASGKYGVGCFGENFELYKPAEAAHKKVRSLSHFTMNPFIRGNIEQLLTVMHDIHAETADDDELLFGILPFIYATMTTDNLVEAIKGIKVSEELRKELQFVLGDL